MLSKDWKPHGSAVCRPSRTKGIFTTDADAALVKATHEFVAKDTNGIIQCYNGKYGIENSAELIEQFRPVVGKWFELTANVSSVEEVEDLFWKNLLQGGCGNLRSVNLGASKFEGLPH